MLRFLLRRVLWAVPVVVGAVTISFLLVRLVPGDPVENMLSGQPAQPRLEHRLAEQFHLNKPLLDQYWLYVSGLARGNLGLSLTTGAPVRSSIGQVVGPTLTLAVVATLLGLVLGGIGGIWGSWITSRRLDRAVAALQTVAVSIPTFWLGLLVLTLFSFTIHLFPATGDAGVKSIVLPALSLALPLAAVIAQLLRASMLETLNEPFIVTARAKGLSEWRVRLGHALRNAALPTLNYVGVLFGALLTGAVVVEQVFSRQGLGRLVVTAVNNKDYQLVQGAVLVVALAYIVVSIAIDVVHALLDPRIR